MVVFPLNDKKAPAVPKGSDWRDYQGKADTDLVGIMIPEGVVVFDVDLYKGVTIEDIEQALGVSLPWVEAELQNTRSGGTHYVFRLPGRFDLPNGANLLGIDGFDTRAAGKGYIATGKGYEDLTLHGSVIEALHDVETWPMLPVEVAVRLSSKGDLLDIGDDDGELESLAEVMAEQPLELDLDDVKHYLDKLPDDCAKDSNKWLKTMMGVRHQFEGSEEGYQLFDEFSQRCPEKYDPIQNRKRWDSLGKKRITNPVTFASVIEMAGGVDVELLEKKAVFHEQFVFLTSSAEYLHKRTLIRMGAQAFNVAFNRLTPVNAKGKKQKATDFVERHIKCVNDGMYAPQFGEFFIYDGVEYFNTYRPVRLRRQPQGEAVVAVKRHVAHLLPDQREQDLLINYLAYCVQNPGIKLFWAILLQGVQGDGKSFFAEMMQHVMGRSNCQSVSAEVLDERFTAWADGKCLTFFEEIKLDNYRKYEVLNKLKPYITNPVVSVRRMYRDAYEAINTCNYIALTNHDDALPLDNTDRRYCVLATQWQSAQRLKEFMTANPRYYPELYKVMREGAGQILDWLLTHKIPDWFLELRRAPETNAKERMKELARPEGWLIVEDAINVFQCDEINDHVVNVTLLQKKVDESLDMDFRDFPKSKALSRVMAAMGYHMIGVIQNKDRKNQRYYCKDEKAKPKDFYVPF